MEKITRKLLNWASILEENTREQAETTASMPFIYPHLALMPDAHLGKGATVGSVIPTLGAIIPAAVGVDIGCGMIAVRTQYHRDELPARACARCARRSSGRSRCRPAAYNQRLDRHARTAAVETLRGRAETAGFDPATVRRQLASCSWARSAPATTSSRSPSTRPDRVWLFLHSGSRGVGNKIAQHHIKVARRAVRAVVDRAARPGPGLPGRGHRRVLGLHPRAAVGAGLRAAQPRGDDGPRRRRASPSGIGEPGRARPERVNCHHNYTEQEKHFGKDGVAVPQGRDRRAEGDARADPGLDGHGVVRRGGQGQPARR